ncbi:Alcohol dehydrogenase [Mycobacterium attenuatum]|uniref:alcohol dehydrogenase n=1 Tax=Mycobacterium attenuatum TaxID=2341086 RepID=A0A498Q3N2_9MYCO|nr:Alcohol dehydrogenase [Mycobacterium attenuatum]
MLGIGGLGHFGVQFSRAMGFETIVIARGTAKAEDARRLGAHHYVDSTGGDVGEALRRLGGAAVVLATAGNSAAMAATVPGILPRRELVVVGVSADPLPISPRQLISPGLSITGHPSGTAIDVEDTMHFAVLSGVRAWVEETPFHARRMVTRRWSRGRPATEASSPCERGAERIESCRERDGMDTGHIRW